MLPHLRKPLALCLLTLSCALHAQDAIEDTTPERARANFARTLETAGSESPTAAELSFNRSQQGSPISPDLFGIFFEDLNYAADGGLYAELIQNRSFEYNSTEQRSWNEFTAWETVERSGKGEVGVRTAKPLHSNNPHYLSVYAKASEGGFGISNRGYDGIPVKEGEAYLFSCFAHQLFMGEPWSGANDIVDRPMPLLVRLESEGGELLAEASFTITGREWKQEALRLVPTRADTKARCVVLLKAKGGVALDEISLMPENTFHKRKNGLRADLAQVIADLKPKFVRFPGGCLAHGDGTNNFYRWKDTVGPLEQRRGQRNIWGYHQSVGLGYFEYFQFCEDIGAKPLPVLPAGVSCQNTNFSPGHGQQCLPLQDMPAYIQEVKDLIEWANGPVSSPWGAKRAAAGHPAPFGLKYLGIGNEDAITPAFEERFTLIQDALRKSHPEIIVIGTVGPSPGGTDFERGWSFARSAGVSLVDEHFYSSPDWFWKNLGRYETYDRNWPKVYVGEYAAHEPDRRNTLRSALAEAAAGLSFERNGDVVQLASYAPLLARRGNTQWTPDLIYFTNTEVFPSINYEVQRLLGNNGGDRLLTFQLSALPPDTRLAVSVVRDSSTGNVIVKVVNAENKDFLLKIDSGALAGAVHTVSTTILTGANADVVNEDGKPSAVSLQTKEHRTTGGAFDQLFPAQSMTVLRFK